MCFIYDQREKLYVKVTIFIKILINLNYWLSYDTRENTYHAKCQVHDYMSI